MKKSSGNSNGTKFVRPKRRPCLMAYTLNNTQPVICTLLADQPYFYMDENAISEEEDILGLDSYDNFDAELLEIKNKIESLEKISKLYEKNPQRRMEEFNVEAINVCENSAYHFTGHEDGVDKAIDILLQSRTAKALFDFAHEKTVYFVESHQEKSARYDSESKIILINPDLGLVEKTILAVRELRRHWQHRQGVMIHPLTFHPDHAILINRAQQADLTIAMIRTGWELHLAGHRQVWDYIENSDFGDLGRAFAKEAFTDFRSMNTGKASLAVFERWFMSDRCRHQDKKLIQEMLVDHQGYVFQNMDSSRMVSIDLISALGAQPFGKNYLASSARMIVEDPVFTEVRDRSNANFLWFVKFERSFSETEHALQSLEDNLRGPNLGSHNPFIAGRTPHDTKPSILQFKPNQRQQSSGSSKAKEPNVIHVRFGDSQSR